MGQVFELIADKALKTSNHEDDECHICHQSESDLYPYQGNYQFENGETDDDIYTVCRNCALTKKLRHSCDFEYISTIEQYVAASSLLVEKRPSNIKALIEKYQQTPDIPLFMQYTDRPLCCNDITEFQGHPADQEELHIMMEHSLYWEKQIKEKHPLYDFKKTGSPESLHDIASFKCRHCEQDYVTFQFT